MLEDDIDFDSEFEQFYPEGDQYRRLIGRRRRRGGLWYAFFMFSTIVAILALLSLLLNITNSAFGYVALENKIEPAELVAFLDKPETTTLDDLNKEELIELLREYELGKSRAEESRNRFYSDQLVFFTQEQWDARCAPDQDNRFEACDSGREKSTADVLVMVNELVVQPKTLETWSLFSSIFNNQKTVGRDFYGIEDTDGNIMQRGIIHDHPNARIEMKSWLTPRFVVTPQNPQPELAGVRTAILGSLWVVSITALFSFPIGVGSAIYLEEYADPTKWWNKIIQTNINNLAGVPSIIYGLLGVAMFVRFLEFFTSGEFVLGDAATANGRTVVSAGLTLGLLILPIIIINAQEAIRAVPNSLRLASYGLGATRWQTIWNHVLPSALPGILTGTILAMSRAIGETAPLVVVGASTLVLQDPSGPFAKFTVMPIQIYQWTARPQGAFQNIAAAAIIVLLILLLTLNAAAIMLRNRFARR